MLTPMRITMSGLLLCLLLAVPIPAAAVEFDLGASVVIGNGILAGEYTETILRTFSHQEARDTSPVLSPLVGAGVNGDFFFHPLFGFGIGLSAASVGGAFSVTDASSRVVGACSLQEINVSAAFRALQRVTFRNGSLYFSEGLSIGMVPGNITSVYRTGSFESTVSAPARGDDARDYALFALGLEARAGYRLPLGPGSISGLVSFSFIRIPTGALKSFGQAFLYAPGLEIGYTRRMGK